MNEFFLYMQTHSKIYFTIWHSERVTVTISNKIEELQYIMWKEYYNRVL